jgi:hypothetical protein
MLKMVSGDILMTCASRRNESHQQGLLPPRKRPYRSSAILLTALKRFASGVSNVTNCGGE